MLQQSDVVIYIYIYIYIFFFFFFARFFPLQDSLVAQQVKNLPAMQETQVQFLGWEDPLENGQASHSSVLELPWWLSWQRIHLQCEKPGFNAWVGKIPWRRERLPTPVFWPGEFHGLNCPWGCKGSDTTKQLSLSRKWYHMMFAFFCLTYFT